METRDSSLPYSYTPLPAADDAGSRNDGSRRRRRRPVAVAAVVLSAALLLAVVALSGRPMESRTGTVEEDATMAASRGPDAGVSEKTSGASWARLGASSGGDNAFPWSNAMLQWQRTGFHFQPEKNWMNDPNGPVYYKGWYHLFYQYNPDGAIWGNKIAWGHAVSRDLVHWRHLPLAMVPDQWYDINGVWTGSATVLPDGRLAMLYTGSTNESVQVQCLAVPSDPNDPLLTNWTKFEGNPVLYPPAAIGPKDFRDPTTAWYDDPSDRTWRLVIGSKEDPHHAGIAVTYKTNDFVNYELMPGVLHRVEGTGMWECIDFYPVVTGTHGKGADNGIDMSDAISKNGVVGDVVHVMKASMDDDRHDYYALGSLCPGRCCSTPRPVATCSSGPWRRVETLRKNATDFSGITIDYGSVFPLNLHRATQLDILAEFELDSHAVMAINEADVAYNCSTSGGSANRGALGPFGLLVLAHRREQTAVYFYVAKGLDGRLTTHFCQDESRSSSANDIVKRVVGNVVPVLRGETLSVRVLVDHSIVESFAMGGRSTATSRVYPTEAIYANAGVYLFNNATAARVTAKTLVVHEMDSSYNQAYMAEL
ncbi:hypothetical protein PR202_gb05961 [Eleusine coracana subsp. coracana]|uniref:Beta-fructofuranosidase n=1 Tax=Eleusine coracana subsp. coracana TaxID=191504 RepID=A0AAV5E5W2_ELECO|nr:hypothetical protein PR202_gb05961 [Eleusine coracana subsp. coracana]